MRRIFAQARKELTQTGRDRLALALALVLPLILLLLLGTAISLTVHDLPLVIQDLDDSPASRRFVDAFRASITFHVVSWPTDRSPERALTDNKARGVLIIPEQLRPRPRARREHAGAIAGRRHRCQHRQHRTGLCRRDHRGFNQASGAMAGTRPVNAAGTPLVQPWPRFEEVLRSREFSSWASRCSRRCWPRWRWPRKASRRPSCRSMSPASRRTNFCWERSSRSW